MDDYLEWVLQAFLYGLNPTSGPYLSFGFYDVLARLVVIAVAWVVCAMFFLGPHSSPGRSLINRRSNVFPAGIVAILGLLFVGFLFAISAHIWSTPDSPFLLWGLFCCALAAVLFADAYSIPRALARLTWRERAVLALLLGLAFGCGVQLRTLNPIYTKLLVVCLGCGLLLAFFHKIAGPAQPHERFPWWLLACLLVLSTGVNPDFFLNYRGAGRASSALQPLALIAYWSLRGAFPVGLILGVLSLVVRRPRQTSEAEELAGIRFVIRVAGTLMGIAFLIPTVLYTFPAMLEEAGPLFPVDFGR